MEASKSMFEAKTLPSLLIAKRVGNMYTPSLYGCLASLLTRCGFVNHCDDCLVIAIHATNAAINIVT